MRWKTRPLPLPKTGDVREVHRFAWKPVQIGAQTVWLEFYGVRQHYFEPISRPIGDGWWSDDSRYTLDYY